MKVLVNNSLYEMGRKEYRGILKVASKQFPCGIYAVEKDGICELRKDTFDSKEELKKAVAEYAAKGFKVHYNSWIGVIAMTVGKLIEELSKYPKGVGVRFCADIPGNLRSILAVEDISFDTDLSPDEPLNVDILLKEVGKVLPPSMVFWNEVSEVVNWYEEQIGRKLTQAERACIRYQCAIMQSEKPEIKDLKKLGICLNGLEYGGSESGKQ